MEHPNEVYLLSLFSFPFLFPIMYRDVSVSVLPLLSHTVVSVLVGGLSLIFLYIYLFAPCLH